LPKNYLDSRVIYDITKFTTLDFPDNLASILWFSGCNMRCPYCYNAPIVFDKGQISLQEVLDFLKTRQNRLSGVVLSGGECTNYPYLKEFAKEIKSLNFKIKIDTNGLNPSLIKELMEENLVDYIALDYKAPKEKFENITKNRHFEKFSQTLNTLISSNLTFEVRTTIHSKLLGIDDINSIIKDLSKRGYKGTYYLQNYLHTDSTIEDIGKQKEIIDTSKLSDLIDINLREFKVLL